MRLYQDKELFSQIVNKISKEKGINEAIIEKDYFVSLILREITKENKNIVFKGGTSLSKCFGLINRFSEDIDLSCEHRLTQSEIKNINHSIVKIVNDLGFALENENEILSGMDYNKFEIAYPSLYKSNGLKQDVIIETVFSINAYPTENMSASNIIYEYLKDNNLLDKVAFEELVPFEIKTQSIARTFVDKVFALCDYYLNDDISEHSRHLYDIYKMYDNINFDDEFKLYVREIRELRKLKRFCTSADDKYDINSLLKEIIGKEVYKNDYENVTDLITYDHINYDETIKTIQKIIEHKVF